MPASVEAAKAARESGEAGKPANVLALPKVAAA
jgi:hypothetical protein